MLVGERFGESHRAGQLTRSNRTAALLGLGGDEPHPNVIAGIDVMGVDPGDDRRVGDLDPRAAVVLVGDDRVEQLPLASVEHDRLGEVERRPLGAVGALLARRHRRGQPLERRRRCRRAPASPLATARTAPIDVAVLQASQRCRRVRVRRRDRGVPRTFAVAVRRVARPAAGPAHGQQERRRPRVVARE